MRATAEENPDLLWGLRGGGGNFGVVTSFEYRLHPVGPEVIAGGVLHSFADAPELFRFFGEYVAEAPDELSVTASTFRAVAGAAGATRAARRTGDRPRGVLRGRLGRWGAGAGAASTVRAAAGGLHRSDAVHGSPDEPLTPRIRAASTTTGNRTTSMRSPTTRSPRSSSTRRA